MRRVLMVSSIKCIQTTLLQPTCHQYSADDEEKVMNSFSNITMRDINLADDFSLFSWQSQRWVLISVSTVLLGQEEWQEVRRHGSEDVTPSDCTSYQGCQNLWSHQVRPGKVPCLLFRIQDFLLSFSFSWYLLASSQFWLSSLTLTLAHISLNFLWLLLKK